MTRWQKAVGLVGLVPVLWAGNNLYDAISRGSVAPGGPRLHGPPEETSTTQPAGGEHTPPTGGGHDPSQFDHG